MTVSPIFILVVSCYYIVRFIWYTQILNFTFATSGERWGETSGYRGKHPVKLYNSNSVLIFQEAIGDNNSGKLPSGGVVVLAPVASSMSATIANPITFYGGGTVINQAGQSGDLYNYYLTSYSRGTDGEAYPNPNNPQWHNLYLDSYIPLRYKSIYDPCPYGYRIPSNGTYNQFANTGWVENSYIGGNLWQQSWFAALGRRAPAFVEFGRELESFCSTIANSNSLYAVYLIYNKRIYLNVSAWGRSSAMLLRCIEECELR